jgi:hypothetical protein
MKLIKKILYIFFVVLIIIFVYVFIKYIIDNKKSNNNNYNLTFEQNALYPEEDYIRSNKMKFMESSKRGVHSSLSNLELKKFYVVKQYQIQHKNLIKNTTHKYINFTDNFNDIKHINPKIIPITLLHNNLYYNNSIFNLSTNKYYLYNIKMLNNKTLFAEFMMNNFNKNIPLTYYFNYKNKTYINENFINSDKKIKKANNSAGGKRIEIIYNIDLNMKDIIISKYHEHSIFYVGHYLVKNGKIIEQMYLSQNNNDPNYIHKGAVKKYTILEDNGYSEFNIFNKIFEKINYTGFACSDFIMENNNVLVFEINPRMGGSMRKDKKILNKFWNAIVSNF